MRFRLYSLLLAVILAFPAQAVESVAGELEKILSADNPGQMTSLTVTGTMDARDFRFISEKMPKLVTLDLSGATVTELSEKKPLTGNISYFPSDELPAYALLNCNITNVKLPASARTVGEGALAGCSKLTSIELPNALAEIKEHAFFGCTALKEIKGGSNVTVIHPYAFADCTALSTVAQFPKLIRISDYAFYRCPALTAFPFPSSLTAIGEGAFMGSVLQAADLRNCTSLTVVGAWAFADNTSLATASLPDTVESVGEGAFFYNTKMKRVELPQGLTRINDFTFMGNRLVEDAQLPEGLKEIGDYALSDWAAMTTFVIPSSVNHIGTRAMRQWTALAILEARPEVPPTLGDDVWEGVDKRNVTLKVSENADAAYRNAEQWQEFFNAADVEEIEDRTLVVTSDNGIVTIRSSVLIAEAAIFDLSGIMLSLKTPEASIVSFDLTHAAGTVYIVRCRLADNSVKLVKIGLK